MDLNNKLVMTLLVRDEKDILENNICFHLNSGVDYIVVTDNGSVDGTLDILEKYKRKGVLDYIQEPSQTFEQDKWVSRMAAMAIDKYKADYLIHCDADEFWFPKSGNLKTNLKDYGDLIFVDVINYVPPINAVDSLDFNKFRFIVNSSEKCPEKYEDKDPGRYLLYYYHPKIITSKKYRSIGYGNHMINTGEEPERNHTYDIFIHHFPIRSCQHFIRKVINGGLAYEKNPVKDKNMGWHWKKWYKLYTQGKIDEAYKKLCLVDDREALLGKGIIKATKIPRKIKWSKEIFGIRKLLRR